jgi:hypothetical protein
MERAGEIRAEDALRWKHGIFGLIALRQSSGRLLDGFVERWALPAKCAGRKFHCRARALASSDC